MNTRWILPCSLLLTSLFAVKSSSAQEKAPPLGGSIAPSAIGAPRPFIAPETSFAGGYGTNLILNGDFEANTASGCDFNLSNAAFGAEVSNATAFGTAEEIDLMKDPLGCGYSLPPHSGTTKLAIHRESDPNGRFDAFSLVLAAPIVAGQKYHLQFFAVADMTGEPDQGAVEVGLSTSATDFGTLIATGFPGTGMWYQFDFDITAPVPGSYLTVREGHFQAWNHIDAFSLVPCGSSASWSNYGSGWPGTNGVPSFTSSADPRICSTLTLNLGNSRGFETQSAMILGLAPTDIPSADGGHLLVVPTSVITLPLGPAGISLPAFVPCDSVLCGLAVYLQDWQADPGASQGVSFTQGLKLVLGS